MSNLSSAVVAVVVVALSHLPPSPTQLPGLCLIFLNPTGLDFRLAFHLSSFHIRFSSSSSSSSSFHLWMWPHVISLLVLLALIIKLSKVSPQPSCNCLDQTIKPGLLPTCIAGQWSVIAWDKVGMCMWACVNKRVLRVVQTRISGN
jgi:hypothetical protein